jgi:glycosyltransferase involved in cell wall biosynthesis
MFSVLHTEASRGWGGQEIRIVTEAGWLRERGVRVLLAAPPESRILTEAARAAFETIALRMRGPWDVPAIARLARVIRQEKIALVHTHSSIDAWIGGGAARLARVPVVRSRHVSIPIRRGLNPVYTWLADRIVTSGEAIRQLVLAGGVRPDAVVALPAGVDLAAFSPGEPSAAVRAELGDSRPVIGSIAMFRGSKGHDHLLEAFRGVREEFAGARLLLVGDGIRRQWVEGLARERGLAAAVRFTGFRRDVPDLLRLMDCFVLASTRTEGVPQSLLQAMAAGVPVAASAIGGIPEVVADGRTGLLVPPEDPAALARAVVETLRDRGAARVRAEAARDLVRSRFSHDRCVDRLLALYAELTRRDAIGADDDRWGASGRSGARSPRRRRT